MSQVMMLGLYRDMFRVSKNITPESKKIAAIKEIRDTFRKHRHETDAVLSALIFIANVINFLN